MALTKVAIIGDGKIAGDCVNAVAARSDMRVCVLVHHSDADWRPKASDILQRTRVVACGNANDPVVVDALRAASPDLIVNANSFDILRDEILGISRGAVVNFHNGLLPAYRGMNIPTWAIFNREERHGVTWHLVDRAIDSGDILVEEQFEVSPDETALSLTIKCLEAGLRQFGRLLQDYAVSGGVTGTPQQGVVRYYKADDVPNDGYIDFGWRKPDLERFVRSMTFRPFHDPKLRMRFKIGDQQYYSECVEIADVDKPTLPPKSVLGMSVHGITVATVDAVAKVSEVSDTKGNSIAGDALPIRVGQLVGEPARVTPTQARP